MTDPQNLNTLLRVPKTLHIIDFNVWHHDLYRKERLEWLIKMIKERLPEVLILQEVNNPIILDLTNELRYLGYQYKISEPHKGVYELLASRYIISNYKFNRYSNSPIGNGVLWADIKVHDEIVTIASTQLDNSPKRREQLKCILNYFKTRQNPVIIGCDTKNPKGERLDIDESYWYDVWKMAGRNKYSRFTVDYQRNNNVDDGVQYRPDRVYVNRYFDKHHIYQNLIGTEKMENGCYPSYYFGHEITAQF